MSDMTQSNWKNHWYEEEIHLKRPTRGNKSLGITIAGGIDEPFHHPRFTSIIIIRILENGLADRDQRLKLYDIILRVNTIDLTNMKHRDAFDALKNSGENVQLLIRRLSQLIIDEIELEHNGKLGISIGGGLGHDNFQTDPRIVITGIDEHQTNNQLDIGDRLLQISSMNKTYDLQFITQDIARRRIESACSESQKIKLCVGRRPPIIRVSSKRCVVHQGQYDSHDLNDEDTIHVNQTQYLIAAAKDKHTQTQTEDLDENRQINNATLNEQRSDNRREQPLAVSFKFDDHQRCEECSKVSNNLLPHDRDTNRPPLLSVVEREQPQSHVIKFMKIEGNSYILGVLFFQQQYSYTIAPTAKALRTDQKANESHQNPITEQRNAHPLEREETAIDGTSAEQLTRREYQMSRRTCMNRESTANGENSRRSCNDTEV